MEQTAIQLNQCSWGLEVGKRDLDSHPERGLLLTLWRWPDEARMSSCAVGNDFWEFPNCQRGRTSLHCQIALLFLSVNTYCKAIEKDQAEVPLMLLQTQARKGSYEGQISSAHCCWLLFIVGTTRVPAFQAAVPSPVLIKADPSVPQVSPRRLLRLPHVRTDENYTWYLETEPLRKRIGNLPISHACWRLNIYDLWQKPCIYGTHQKMKKGQMKDDAQPHKAVRVHGIYSILSLCCP